MKILVPYDDSYLARFALQEACRIVTPLDEVIAMAAVVVPHRLPVDVMPGEIWKETCRAEVRLARARDLAERVAHYGDLRCVRVQARGELAAILAGAAGYAADTIFLAERANLGGRVATFFGATAAIVRHAPCDVRMIFKVTPNNDIPRPVPDPIVASLLGSAEMRAVDLFASNEP